MKLVSSYTLLHWQRVSKLIHHPALGDQHPTTLMYAMNWHFYLKMKPLVVCFLRDCLWR